MLTFVMTFPSFDHPGTTPGPRANNMVHARGARGKVILKLGPLCSLQGVGGLGPGQQSRTGSGGGGASGLSMHGPKKLPKIVADCMQNIQFLQVQ
jgi:hypothetical protein